MRILTLLLFSSLFFISTSQKAYALAEGCNPDVRAAQVAKAEAMVAADVAVTEEIVRQNDSVLALTCFDQASRVSASEGGAIFSGDFTNSVNQVVDGSLTNLLSTGFLDSIGKSPDFSNIVGNAINGLLGGLLGGLFGGGGGGANFDCTVMQDLWDDVIVTGLNNNAPFLTFDEMVATSFSGGNTTNFLTNLSAESGGAFGQAEATRNALPVNVIPSFVGTTTLEEVLTAAGY